MLTQQTNLLINLKIINAASELIFAVFGENGKHTRAAISANSLPLDAAIEIDAIFELK